MLTARQQVQLAFAALALLVVVLYTSAAFEAQYPKSTRSPLSANTFFSSTKDTGEAGVLHRLELVLSKLESTPIQSYEVALKKNEQTCKNREVQSNPDQIKGESTFWQDLSSETLEEKRQNVIQAIRQTFGLPGLQYSTPETLLQSGMYGEGRGLVFTGGNKDTLHRIASSLRILRHRHNCNLPVEIFAFPEELADSKGSAAVQELEKLGDVVFKELHSSSKHNNLWKNFQIKAESIVQSSFSEILYMDSDNILLADPTFLFDHPVYKQNGVVFWPDITKDGPTNPIWRMLDMQCKREDWQLDSGQILVDKRGQQGLNLAALIAALEMQKDFEFWFKLSGGDKDTFRYGFYFLGLPYSTPEHWLSSFGPIHNYEKDGHTFCGLAMFQYSLSPQDWDYFPSAKPSAQERSTHAPPLFVHANLLKHSSLYKKGEVWTTLKRMKSDKMGPGSDTDHFRSIVYHSRNGMCVDIWDAFDTVNPRKDGTFDNGAVIIEDVSTAFGGVLSDFEEMFWAEGGKGGGF